ncbi:MAG: AAA family ATPase [Sulfitobacter sp.]
MKIIENVEIRHFRSFDGGTGQSRVHIQNLGDLNVFSGANDSGKSNVLRALNLFFNNEISPGVPFDKERDFSKTVSKRFDQTIVEKRGQEKARVAKLQAEGEDVKARDLRRSDEVISIKLFFNNIERQRGLPEKFWVSRSYSQKNGFEGEYIYQTDLKGNAQVSLFLSSFQFEYVPAIKDRTFFNHLFQKLQTYLFEKEDKKKMNKFSESSENFNDALTSETKELFDKFRASSGVDANFHIPSTLVDFFRTLSVRTENNISLFERGDGVQARFIPEILEEMSNSSKRNVIWGFEEPENSYEAKNIRKIRDDFLHKYSRTKQVFVTSHTSEFLSTERAWTKYELEINDNAKLSGAAKRQQLQKLPESKTSSSIVIYRVWKSEGEEDSSHVTRFDETSGVWEETCDDLGLIQEARIVESLQNTIKDHVKKIETSDLSLELQKRLVEELNGRLAEAVKQKGEAEEAIEEYLKPILYVEDKYDHIYKIAYLKLKGIAATKETFESEFKMNAPFVIRRGESAGGVSGRLRVKNTDGYEDKKIVGLFDFDKEGTEQFYHLKNEAKIWCKDCLGEPKTGLHKKRIGHPCFYALLIPVPERHLNLLSDVSDGKFNSYVEIENLLPDEFLMENNLVSEEQIVGEVTYKKIKDDKKSKMSALLLGADAENFSDFEPLYTKILELFEFDE